MRVSVGVGRSGQGMANQRRLGLRLSPRPVCNPHPVEFPSSFEIADAVRAGEASLASVTANLVDVDDFVDEVNEVAGVALVEFVG